MTENLNIAGLSEDETVTLNLLVEQLAQKRRRNFMRSSIYDGKRAVRQVGTVIPPQYTNLGLALGWAAKGVDGLGRRCTLEDMIWADGDIDSLGLDELLDDNFLLSEVAQARTDSLIHGVSYLITTKGMDDEPAALFHTKDALNATGEWNNRTRRLDNLISVTSWKDGKINSFVLYLKDMTISADKSSGKWVVEDRSEHSWGVPVDPMVYRPRGSRRMGRSRISRPAISHQDSAIRALVRLEGHMDIYTIPKMILLGADESVFKNADGTLKASWQVALGRVFGIPDDEDAETPRADVKQFNAASPEPHLAQLNALAKLMAREMDMSDADFALTDMSNPTSEGSYSEARENLIAEAEGATDDWSISIRRAVTRALAIQNDLTEVPKEWRSIKAKWRDPRFLSRAAAADAGSKQLAAVPWLAETEVGLKLLGLSTQDIEIATAERRRGQVGSLIDSLRTNAAQAVTDPAVAAVAGSRSGG